MASTALARAERYAASLKKLKAESKNTTRRGLMGGAALGGAAAAGLLDAKFPGNGGAASPANIAGGLLFGAGVLGLVDEYSDYLVAAGAGMLGPTVRDEVKAACS